MGAARGHPWDFNDEATRTLRRVRADWPSCMWELALPIKTKGVNFFWKYLAEPKKQSKILQYYSQHFKASAPGQSYWYQVEVSRWHCECFQCYKNGALCATNTTWYILELIPKFPEIPNLHVLIFCLLSRIRLPAGGRRSNIVQISLSPALAMQYGHTVRGTSLFLTLPDFTTSCFICLSICLFH